MTKSQKMLLYLVLFVVDLIANLGEYEMKYIQREDYDGFEVEGEGLHRISCCDCGLVHDMAVAIEDNGKIGLAFKRNNRATAQIRRYRFNKPTHFVKANLYTIQTIEAVKAIVAYVHKIANLVIERMKKEVLGL